MTSPTALIEDQTTSDHPTTEQSENNNFFYIRPIEMTLYVRSNLKGLQKEIFWYVWEQTVQWDHNNTWETIANSVFQEATSYKETAIRTALQSLISNKWLDVQTLPGMDMHQYRIPALRLIEGKYPEFLQWDSDRQAEKAKPEKVLHIDTPPSENEPILDLDLDQEKKEPKPKLIVVNTGNSKRNANDLGSGSLSKSFSQKESELFKELIAYGIYTSIVISAITQKGYTWTINVYEEFLDNEYSDKHQMKNARAILGKRLQDFEGKWRR